MKFGRSNVGALTVAVPTPSDEARRREQVRKARVDVARTQGWEEIPRSRLVSRGPGNRWLVDSDDAVYTVHRGSVFVRDSATLVTTHVPAFAYFLDEDGDIVALDRQPKTWTEIYTRHMRHTAKAAS